MLKFGIIGAGMISQTGYDGVIQSGAAEVVAVADTHPGRLAEFASRNHVPRTFPTAPELIASRDIDAVYVAVPNALHAPLAIAALNAGKHVILDKPFATSVAEAEQVVAAAGRSGKLFMVGMNRRFEEGPQKVKAAAERGYFGDIYRMRAFWRRRADAPRLGTWFGHRKLSGGGCFLDIGVHVLDLALWLAGNFEPESVCGAAYTTFGNRGLGQGAWGASTPEGLAFDVEDGALALVRMKNGASVQVEVSWVAHQKESQSYNVELFGSQAGALAFPGEVYRFDDALEANVDISHIGLPIRYPHKNRFVNFVSAIRGEEEPCVTHEQALAVQRIIDAFYQSSDTRREVRL